MSVDITDAIDGPYYGDGSTKAFPFTIAAAGADEIAVYAVSAAGTEVISKATYTVSYSGKNGTVTFANAPADIPGTKLYIASDPDFTQQIKFGKSSNFLPDSVNDANDRAAIRDLVLRSDLQRAPKYPVGEFAPEFPGLASRIGDEDKVLGFDQWTGEIKTMPVGSFPPGPTGPVANTYFNLSTFKAQPVSNANATLMTSIGGVSYSWMTGDYSGVDPSLLDTIFLQSDSEPLTVGVWKKNGDTVSIKDFGGIGDGVTSNDDAGAKAITYLASRGGGTLHFPTGDYPIKLIIDSPGITILAEAGTVLRASGPSTIIDITANGVNATVDGPVVTGQTLAEESIINTGGVKNTSAAYGIRSYAKGTTLRNFKAKACRFDPLYIRVDGEADFIAENFEIGPSARNAASIITGHRFNFSKGTMRQSNEFSSGTYDGLYLFDHEPNIATDTFDTIEFNDVEFINEGGPGDSWEVMFHTTYLPDNILNAVFNRCRFKKGGVATTPAGIRLAGGTRFTYRGLTVRDCSFEGRAVSTAGAEIFDLEDSLFENIDLGESALTYGVVLQTGVVLRDIRSPTGPVVLLEGSASVITRQNVAGLDDQSPNAAIVQSLSAVEGPLIVGQMKDDPKIINVTDTVNFTDILTLGTRATFKITIGGADANGGAASAHISEHYITVSNDTAYKGVANIIVNIAGSGLDVQWKDATDGIGTDKRTLQVRPQKAASNQYGVLVEVLSNPTGTTSGEITWLV